MKKKKNQKNNTIAIITGFTGILLLLISRGIYSFFNKGYLYELHSEMGGVGIGFIVLSIGFFIFKRRIA